MPTPVDLTAILPVLKQSVAPFEDALSKTDSVFSPNKVSDATMIRSYAYVGDLRLSQLRKLVDSVNAIRRMAGEKV